MSLTDHQWQLIATIRRRVSGWIAPPDLPGDPKETIAPSEKERFEKALASAVGDFVRRSVSLFFSKPDGRMALCVQLANSIRLDIKASGYDIENFLDEPIRNLIHATDETFEARVMAKKALLELVAMSRAGGTVQ